LISKLQQQHPREFFGLKKSAAPLPRPFTAGAYLALNNYLSAAYPGPAGRVRDVFPYDFPAFRPTSPDCLLKPQEFLKSKSL
jgi:hypothetical protein